jgi:hypothetical protein
MFAKWVTARKHHFCSTCSFLIKPGDEYYVRKWPPTDSTGWTRWSVLKQCKTCFDRGQHDNSVQIMDDEMFLHEINNEGR